MSDLLRFQRVEKVYEHGRHRERVLSDVSFSVPRSQIVAVIGDRFGGKTTLLRLAAGIAAPTGGAVLLDGVDLASLSERDRSRLMTGCVSWCSREGSKLLNARDFVALPTLMREVRTEDGARPRLQKLWQRKRRNQRGYADAERVLAQLGIEDCARRGWDELSRWEQICVSLARGIVCEPRLLLIDDLLDGLGTKRTLEAGALLRRVVMEVGCGILLTVSDVEAAMLADRVLCLQRGRLRKIADQTVDETEAAPVIALRDRHAVRQRR
jgi:ABC-type cobalamin/Fe3+-siderophores transport system ATPase subunit